MPRSGDPIFLDRPVTWVAMAGFMGTGKSRIGWELARALALHFIDTDKYIEKTSGLTIPQIFETFGEAAFRDMENNAVEHAFNLENFVISLGGGTFVQEANREKLLQRGPVVCLWASAETIFERTRNTPRVLLQVSDPIGKIQELLETRRAAYNQAPIHVSTDNRKRSEVVEEIMERLREYALHKNYGRATMELPPYDGEA